MLNTHLFYNNKMCTIFLISQTNSLKKETDKTMHIYIYIYICNQYYCNRSLYINIYQLYL